MNRFTVAAFLACVLATPLPALAASLSPLENDLSLDTMLSETPGAGTTTATPTSRSGKDGSDFQFVDGEVLTGDPLRDILPENQWANPKAANANGLLLRR
ncbi:hypothetical protein [Meridianimarinicoccus roseus]|nr:hypothetical protein [Meridianimarinicoccus roseus]